MSTPHRQRGEGGSATVLVLAVAGVVLASGALAATIGGAVVVRHRAAVAADAAALAAASVALDGAASACDSAAAVARANGGTLASCVVDDSVAEVSVSLHAGGWLAWLPSVRLNARAGPAETYREEPAPLVGPS